MMAVENQNPGINLVELDVPRLQQIVVHQQRRIDYLDQHITQLNVDNAYKTT